MLGLVSPCDMRNHGGHTALVDAGRPSTGSGQSGGHKVELEAGSPDLVAGHHPGLPVTLAGHSSFKTSASPTVPWGQNHTCPTCPWAALRESTLEAIKCWTASAIVHTCLLPHLNPEQFKLCYQVQRHQLSHRGVAAVVQLLQGCWAVPWQTAPTGHHKQGLPEEEFEGRGTVGFPQWDGHFPTSTPAPKAFKPHPKPMTRQKSGEDPGRLSLPNLA